MAGFEYEVRIRDGAGRPMSSGISYSLGEIGRFDALLEVLVPAFEGLGVELEAVHTEAAPGLLELNIAARRGLQAADDAALLKFAVKETAASLGLSASFLAKTEPLEEGSSGHVHMSFWQGGENAFAPGPGEDLPEACMSAVAGLLDHLPAASLLINPTVNSYKRLVPGYFAPVNVSWGYENRSASVRAIRGSRPARSRLECRRPGADANPYLALAALVSSAVLGIREGSMPPPAREPGRVRAERPSGPSQLLGERLGGIPRRCRAANGAGRRVQRVLRHLESLGAESLAAERERLGAGPLHRGRLSLRRLPGNRPAYQPLPPIAHGRGVGVGVTASDAP